MKLKNIFWVIFLSVIVLSGCDEIGTPLIQKQRNGNLPNTPPNYTDSSKNYNVYKLLLEDCMGHLCSNCPSAVIVGDGLIAPSNPLSSQIILMEENMGSFATTTTIAGKPDSAFAKDYTCQAGNKWLTEFQMIFFPWGMINRAGYPNNTFVQYTNWTTTVQADISQNPSPLVTINIHDSCWTSPRIIGADFQITFKKAMPDTSYLLEAVIIEDSIIDWQEDDLLPSGFDSAFVHRNVLRGSFDGTGIGNAIPTTVSSVTNGTWTSFQTYDFTAGENGKAAKWNMAHCYIVAFVYNSISKAVVQAEMIKME